MDIEIIIISIFAIIFEIWFWLIYKKISNISVLFSLYILDKAKEEEDVSSEG